MTPSWWRCVRKAWTSPGGPWPNIVRRCTSRTRRSASVRRPCPPDTDRPRTYVVWAYGADGRVTVFLHRYGRRAMQITVSGKQVEMSDALRTRVAEQLEGVAGKYFDH